MIFSARGKFAILILCLIAVCASNAYAAPARRVFAYYMTPAADTAPEMSIREFADAFTDVAPTILLISDAKGTVTITPDTKHLEIPLAPGTSIAPVIQNTGFDKKIAKWVLMSPAAQKKVVQSTLDFLKTEPRYSGVVVDVENTSPSDRDFYTEFISRLYDALHPLGYKVYTVVGPKEEDIPISLWVRAFDYKALGKCSDYVILMTYNQHWRGGVPGPCAGLDWFESCVKYAVDCIPAEKVIVGLPFYGYDWPEKQPGISLTHKKAAALIVRVKPNIQWHEQWATPWFSYTEKGLKHEVWFEDVRSLEAKLGICRKYNVGGIAAWRPGDEDPKFWEAIKRYESGQ